MLPLPFLSLSLSLSVCLCLCFLSAFSFCLPLCTWVYINLLVGMTGQRCVLEFEGWCLMMLLNGYVMIIAEMMIMILMNYDDIADADDDVDADTYAATNAATDAK